MPVFSSALAYYDGLRRDRLPAALTQGLRDYFDTIIAAYDEAAPLADGWQERVGLHQLFPIMLHAVIFGGGYVMQSVETARKYA